MRAFFGLILLIASVQCRSIEKKYNGGYSISESRSESFNAVPVQEKPVFGKASGGNSDSTPVPLIRHDFNSDHMGNHQLEYETGDGTSHSSKSFVKDVNGAKVVVQTGTISWTTPDGKKLTLHYVADEKGFRVEGDHLPDQPPDADKSSAEKPSVTSYEGYSQGYSSSPQKPAKPAYNYNHQVASPTISKPSSYGPPAAPAPEMTTSKPAYGTSYSYGTQTQQQKPVAAAPAPSQPSFSPSVPMPQPQPLPTFPQMPAQPAPQPLPTPSVPSVPMPTFLPMPQPQPTSPPLPPQPTFQPLPQPTFPAMPSVPSFPSFTARPPRPAPTTTTTAAPTTTTATTTSAPFVTEAVAEPISSIGSSQFAISPGLQGANIIQAPIVPILAGPGSADLMRTVVSSEHMLIDSDHKRTVIRIHERPT